MEEIKKYIEKQWSRDIRYAHTVEPVPGETTPFPPMSEEIISVLKSDGVHSLYQHQIETFHSVQEGNHTLLVSSTSSGKTLAFFLPILNHYLDASSPFTTLFLYPTKALSRDQEGTFGKLMSVVKKSGKLGTFDGDTPQDERGRIQRSADFIITNPDMLHGGILPNHNRKWKDMLSRLQYVVVDEVHTYRGAFGSHVANVFRRLKRICNLHGSDPIFICSSATIGNPSEHAKNLFQAHFNVIEQDTAPRPVRNWYFINPPLVQSQGDSLYRKGPGSISVKLIRHAVLSGTRTIVFCRARQEVERLYKAVIEGDRALAAKVKPYRGGLLPTERRKLEKELAEGKLTAVITTNALELGIDIGTLDLCIIQGHPGTVASFHQQAGRVGRSGKESVVVYIAKDSPLDQYIVNHGDFIMRAPVESARTNVDNPYIVLQHLPCAAHEYPLAQVEPAFWEPAYTAALEALKGESLLVPYKDYFRYSGQDYPTRGVNLRGLTDYNVEIYCGTEVIGEIDPVGARGSLYKDAIYQHLGTRYMSMELDLEKKLCRVEPVTVDYYTEAHWEKRLDMTAVYSKQEYHGAKMSYGSLLVNKQPKLYKKIREKTLENIGYGPITLPAFEYETTGFSINPPEEWVAAVSQQDIRIVSAALYGLSYLVRHTSPALCMADVSDINSDVSLSEIIDESWKSSLYFYDTIEGGVGYTEEVFYRFTEALELARECINSCQCESGCPSCVPPLPPGVDSEDLESYLVESDAALASTISLITKLLEDRVEVPEITTKVYDIALPVEEPEVDREGELLKEKMSRASEMLKRKRDRLH